MAVGIISCFFGFQLKKDMALTGVMDLDGRLVGAEPLYTKISLADTTEVGVVVVLVVVTTFSLY